MRKHRLIVCTILPLAMLWLFTATAHCQTACPDGQVCISPEAARKALVDADKVIALEKESAAKDQAVKDITAELNNMRVQFAEKSGENTALKQNAVQDRSIIEVLLKNVRPKKIGLINLF